MIETFLLDSIMILLLFCAIGFCWRLNIRLNSLKNISSSVTPAIHGFNNIVEKVTLGIQQLKEQTQKTKSLLTTEVPKAQNLKDDLELLLEYAENSSKRLERLVQDAHQTESEIKNIFESLHKVLPKNFHDTLKNSETCVDFDELMAKKISDISPTSHKIEIPLKFSTVSKGLIVNDSIIQNMKNLR
jgi:regulator of replication initiation timing